MKKITHLNDNELRHLALLKWVKDEFDKHPLMVPVNFVGGNYDKYDIVKYEK
jgi:hypothetical protein